MSNSPVTAGAFGACACLLHAIARRVGLHLQLGKAGLTAMVAATTAVGFVVAYPTHMDWGLLAWTLLGTGLGVAGANAMNQWLERSADARMGRTRHRPLPVGAMLPRHALVFALAMCVGGPMILTVRVNGLTTGLVVATQLVYLFGYTPLKRRSASCTLLGACCGAVPPVVGWTAATGSVTVEPLILAAMLYVWQIPHFLAADWLHRDDYARAGFRTLSGTDRSGSMTGRMAILYSLALVPLSLLVTLTGLAGAMYAGGVVLLGGAMVLLSVRLHQVGTAKAARRLYVGNLVYLPAMLALMLADPGPARCGPAIHSLRQGQAVSVVEQAEPMRSVVSGVAARRAGSG